MLTEASVEPLGLVLPVDAQVVDGHARQHDQQADATHQGLRVEREDQQEAPEQQVDDRPHQADLQDTTTTSSSQHADDWPHQADLQDTSTSS